MLPDLRKQETILHILQSVDQVPRLYCTVLHTVLYTVLHTVQVARLADHIADTVDQRCDQFMARLQGISQVGDTKQSLVDHSHLDEKIFCWLENSIKIK